MSDTKHLACPSCAGINRISAARLHDAPKCGKCGRQLFTASPVDLTQANFNQHVARSDIPVLVDFWAPWCGPCKMMAPAFKQAARQLEPLFRLAKVNTETEQMLGSQFGIRSIPTMVLFHQGREIARQAGAMGAGDIVNWVHSHKL
jgi:thioredoxin 2